MRLIKAQSTNIRNIKGRGIKYDINDTVQLDSEVGAIMPTGRTIDRSDFPTNGTLRYNTDTEAFEGYADGTWKEIRRVEATTITQVFPTEANLDNTRKNNTNLQKLLQSLIKNNINIIKLDEL